MLKQARDKGQSGKASLEEGVHSSARTNGRLPEQRPSSHPVCPVCHRETGRVVWLLTLQAETQKQLFRYHWRTIYL